MSETIKTKKPLKTSYTKLDTYKSCPRKYKLQYKDYIISDYIPSPFFFGGSIDQASEVILADKMIGSEKIPFDFTKMVEVFTKSMTEYKFQLEDIYLPTSPLVKYAKADIDLSLLDNDDLNEIELFIKEDIDFELDLDNLPNFMEATYPILKKDRSKVSDSEKELYNFVAWLTLYNKGLLMLDALKEWVDENILEVYSCQRKFEIVNDEGDTLIGAIDIECMMKDGIKRTLDLKTASNASAQYPNNCTDTAMQLHIYSEVSVKDVGYVVIDKTVRKKEPRIRIRYVEGTLTEEMLDRTFEDIDNTMEQIKNDVEFPCNKDSCFRYGKCDFYGLCNYGSMKGLLKRKFEDKKPKTEELK